MTYGDGLADIDIGGARSPFTSAHGAQATVACVRPPARFGAHRRSTATRVPSFEEKPQADSGLINGGFFVLEPYVLDLIAGRREVWEQRAAGASRARTASSPACVHRGFWQPMDTLRDKQSLNALWDRGAAPWKVWEG